MSLSAPSFAVLEVYQFARDATVAETWLIAHEPYLRNQDFGDSLDKVESLIKKHEAFEKSAATQEDRFLALERLTTVRRRPDVVSRPGHSPTRFSCLSCSASVLYPI